MREGAALIEVNGARLWTRRQGTGPPLVLLHGGPGAWDDFDALAALLDDTVEVHRYDQRGCGRSADVPPYDVDTFVADLDALRAHWGHDRWIVGGHSWGTCLALAYAVQRPERVEALVLLAATGVIDDWRDEYHTNADARRTPEQRARYHELRAVLKQAPERWTDELDREYCVLAWAPDFAYRERAVELARSAPRPYGPNQAVNEALNEHWRLIIGDESFARRVAGLDAPALIVHGAEDPRPLRIAERLAASMRQAELEIIEGAGHLPWVERPERTGVVLRAFLSRVAARAARAVP